MLVRLLAVLICASNSVSSVPWGYRVVMNEGVVLPKDWGKVSKDCAGSKQSPIDIRYDQTVYDNSLNTIIFNRADLSPNVTETWSLLNNGKTGKVQDFYKFLMEYSLNAFTDILAELGTNKKYFINLQGETFEFLQMHFHWHGSEHEINGVLFPAELHLVTKSLNATEKKLAVIGIFLKVVDEDNVRLASLVDGLKSVRDYKAQIEVFLDLTQLIPATITNYYRYIGSLTAPSCDEIVTWSVVDPEQFYIPVSISQLLEFQMMRDQNGHEILMNARNTQKLNGRTLTRSFYPNELKKKINPYF